MTITLGRLLGDDAAAPRDAASIPVLGLTSDSRMVKPGFVFAALAGSSADGSRYIPQAIAAGAVAVIGGPALQGGGVPTIAVENPRRVFAHMAARFFGRQPNLIVAVTGTNGKTSVASFVRELWTSMGFRAASLGTVGVVSPSGVIDLQHTTPDPVHLHDIAARLAVDHVQHLAIEASSHGLDQCRLDGLRLAAGAFTNITRDHLDYHTTFDAYFDAKMRLFEELLPAGSPAVINADSPHAPDVGARCARRTLSAFTVGRAGSALKLLSAEREGFGQRLVIAGPTRRHHVLLPLVGDFQVSNALVAAGLVIAAGGEEDLAIHGLESLKGARGRLELVGRSPLGAPVFVDYAHTPDALENAIASLRPYVTGQLAVAFGCGGDRDRGKRPQMGAVAVKYADRVYVTDDNPRSENPALIRRDILAASPGAIEIGDRAAAIRTAVEGLRAGDILLVAGKGHEQGQKIGATVIPFSDHDAVQAALAGEDYHG